ncbi:MAG TPA: ABC transporter permease [Thermoplasmata archaeon]
MAPAAEKRRPSQEFVHLIPMVLVAVGFLAIWEVLVQLQVWKIYLFPGPSEVGAAFADLWNNSTLARSIGATLSRLAVGFLLSLVLGSILALLMVHFATFGKGIQPYVLGLQTFPSIAWVPLSLVWFGFSETALLFVTIIGSLFSVTVSAADSLRTVPPIYLKAARNMGCDGMDLILRVTVPATLPHLISSAKVGWSFAWRSLIGAEVIFATIGLGFLVEQGSEYLNTAQVMAVMLVILILGIVVDRVVFSRSQEWINRRWGLVAHR